MASRTSAAIKSTKRGSELTFVPRRLKFVVRIRDKPLLMPKPSSAARVNHPMGAEVHQGVYFSPLHPSSTKPVRGSLVQSPMMQRHQESPDDSVFVSHHQVDRRPAS
jgi:hypothetical protein